MKLPRQYLIRCACINHYPLKLSLDLVRFSLLIEDTLTILLRETSMTMQLRVCFLRSLMFNWGWVFLRLLFELCWRLSWVQALGAVRQRENQLTEIIIYLAKTLIFLPFLLCLLDNTPIMRSHKLCMLTRCTFSFDCSKLRGTWSLLLCLRYDWEIKPRVSWESRFSTTS
jgi:hypothetical protein